LSWWLHGLAQIADGALLPSEQMTAGGVASVRGYPTYTVRGDNGVQVNNEVRLPESDLGGRMPWRLDTRIVPFLFVDYATVAGRGSGAPYGGTLTSFGPGVRLTLDRRAEVVLDGGGQIRVGRGHGFPGQFFDVAVVLRY
jgi:hemolysin activation/secretion protein